MKHSSVSLHEPWPARIEARSAVALRREIGRAMAAGELAACGPVRPVVGGYAVDVLRLRDRAVAPAWRRPVLVVGGVVAVLAGVAAAGWWLAGVTAAALGAVSLPVVGVGGALLWLSYASLTRSSGCETTVTIRHRH